MKFFFALLLLLCGTLAKSQYYFSRRTCFYENIQAFNKESDIDSAVITFKAAIHSVKGLIKNEDNIDAFLETYEVGYFNNLKYYFNKNGSMDSFFTCHVDPNCYVKKWKIICGETTYSDTERVVARYDSLGSLIYGYVEDGRDSRYKETVSNKLLNTYDQKGRLIEAMSEDSTFRKRIFYQGDSIIEIFDDIKFYPRPDYPVLDKLFRGIPGSKYNFFDWSPSPDKRIEVYSGGKIVKLIEKYDYGGDSLTTETDYVYTRKGKLKNELIYKYRDKKLLDEYCVKTYRYSVFGNLSWLEIRYPYKTIIRLNYKAVNNTITERLIKYNRDWKRNRQFKTWQFKLVYKLYK